MKTVGLLIISNIFMTIAWYGHLNIRADRSSSSFCSVGGIALFEYVFQVPANRIGYERFTLMQLKIMQECITLVVFTVFALIVFKETVKWNYVVSYTFIVAAVYFAFKG